MMRNRLFLIIGLLCIFGYGYALDNPETWIDEARYGNAYNTTWYSASASEYTIDSNAKLGGLARKVLNDGVDFEGKTINITADLDMDKYFWVTIDGFKGVFNGNGHTISNLRTNDTSTGSFGLFGEVDGGTIKNVIVNGVAKDLPEGGVVGGIVATLIDGVVENCGYVGVIYGSKEGVISGGIVGNNIGGTIDRCFFNGSVSMEAEEVIFGNIVGQSTGTVTNSYYLENEYFPNGTGIGEGETFSKNRTAFTSGEVAWFLNQDGDTHLGLWAQGDSYPILADKENTPIYKIKYAELENGRIVGKGFSTEGTEIELTVEVEEGYYYENLTVVGIELSEELTFIMPAEDVTITCDIFPISEDEIRAFEAGSITYNSFTARWNEINGATDYLLTVREGDVILENYNGVSTGEATSMRVEDLSPETVYYYYVQSVVEGVPSEPSNEIRVVTTKKQLDIVVREKTFFRAQWENLEDVVSYKLSLAEDTVVIERYKNVETTENLYEFNGLIPNTAYTLTFSIEYEDRIEEWEPMIVETAGDYGHQLNNSGFEYWENEGNYREPVEWNSFYSNGGPLAAMARTLQIKESKNIRPGSYGKLSSSIWTVNKIVALANGNMTCGQIQAVSQTVSDGMNHNKSIISNPEFNEKVNSEELPDSLTVWVRFVPKNSTHLARVAATIHDAYNYSDPSNYDPESLNHIVSRAVTNYPAVISEGEYLWQRLSIPFLEYTANSNLVGEYMLVTFTTNEEAGGGTASDSVYIDDMVLIYTPKISINQGNKTNFSRGTDLTIDYTLKGTMSPTNLVADPNRVILQLAGTEGSFEEEDGMVVMDDIMTDYSGTLSWAIPGDMEMGTYKVRIITTNYPMISEVYEFTIGPAGVNALEPEDIGERSFIAKWGESTEGEEYLLTVRNSRREIVGQYDDFLINGQTSHLVDELEPARAYYYTVRVKVGDYVSEESNEIAVQTEGENPVPDSVEGKPAENIGSHEFTAVWSETTFQNEYEYLLTVMQGEGVVADYNAISTGTETSWVVDGLKPNTEYSYTVVVKAGEYESIPSTPVFVTTDRFIPDPIEALEAEDVTENSFMAKWNASEDATDYRLTVRYEGVPLADYNNILTGLVTKYEVKGLSPDTEYTYTVKVAADDEVSAESEPITVTTDKVDKIDITESSHIYIYPNPARDYIYVNGVDEQSTYYIINISGVVVKRNILASGRIEVGDLSAGVYFIQIEGKKAKFVKE